MNVLEILTQELKDKHWSLEEKIRYVYLRVCEFFVFDYRYRLATQLPNKDEILNYIDNKDIDLTNLNDRYIVCPTYTDKVMPIILQELFEKICNIRHVGGHYYPSCEINGIEIALDATIMDLLRVKMNLTTIGFIPDGENDSKVLYNYDKHLKEIDKSIGYIKDNYEDTFLKDCGRNFTERYLRGEYGEIVDSPDDEFLKKINFIENLYQKYNVQDNFTDAKFCLEYIAKFIFNKSDKARQLVSTLFLATDIEKEWDLINVWRFQLEQTAIFYSLKKENGEYHFGETPYNKILKYQDYKGEAKALLLTEPNTKVLL
ncbi:MAG: hypothetical protein J1F35_03755 [Erysipelotrichales bacterium]|nr:hypothetical protein [Erysipelotrichales bacterium]